MRVNSRRRQQRRSAHDPASRIVIRQMLANYYIDTRAHHRGVPKPADASGRDAATAPHPAPQSALDVPPSDVAPTDLHRLTFSTIASAVSHNADTSIVAGTCWVNAIVENKRLNAAASCHLAVASAGRQRAMGTEILASGDAPAWMLKSLRGNSTQATRPRSSDRKRSHVAIPKRDSSASYAYGSLRGANARVMTVLSVSNPIPAANQATWHVDEHLGIGQMPIHARKNLCVSEIASTPREPHRTPLTSSFDVAPDSVASGLARVLMTSPASKMRAAYRRMSVASLVSMLKTRGINGMHRDAEDAILAGATGHQLSEDATMALTAVSVRPGFGRARQAVEQSATVVQSGVHAGASVDGLAQVTIGVVPTPPLRDGEQSRSHNSMRQIASDWAIDSVQAGELPTQLHVGYQEQALLPRIASLQILSCANVGELKDYLAKRPPGQPTTNSPAWIGNNAYPRAWTSADSTIVPVAA